EDNAVLRLRDIAARLVCKSLQYRLDLFVDVARLGERGRFGGHERHAEEGGQRIAQQGLAGAGGADDQDVALDDMHVGASQMDELSEVSVVVRLTCLLPF